MIHFEEQKRLDIILLGRITIDINPVDFQRSFAENNRLQKFVGGSPANTAVGLARLGCKAGFIGAVSDDSLGGYATAYLQANGVDTAGVIRCRHGEMLGLAFTEIRPDGSTNLILYRNGPVADLQLETVDIAEDYIASAKSLLISGTSLAAPPSREAALKALLLARRQGIPVVFDVDYRPQTWKSKEETAIYYTMVAEQAKIIMGSREEFDLIDHLAAPGLDDEATARRWFGQNAEIIVIKHGQAGSRAFDANGEKYLVRPFPIKFLKATGGGDAYSSAFLSGIIKGLPFRQCLERGTASASMAVAATNCSEALPDEEKLNQFIKNGHDQGVKVIFALE